MKRLLIGAALAAVCSAPAHAGELSPEIVERLGGLSRAWSAARVGHPWAAEDPLKWDAAFVAAAERTLARSSCDDYAATVEEMLATLQDSATQLLDQSQFDSPDQSPPPADRLSRPGITWPDEKTALIDATDWNGLTIGAGGLNAMHSPMFLDVFGQAREAETLIIDLRRPAWDGNAAGFDFGGFMLSAILRRELPTLLARQLPMPSRATRQHYGYQNQGITSEFYHSGHYIRDHRALAPEAAGSDQKQLVFWIGPIGAIGGSAVLADLFSAMQTSGIGVVVSEAGGLAEIDPYAAPMPIQMPCGLTAAIRTGVMVNPDGTTGFAPAATLSADAGRAAWLKASRRALANRAEKPATRAARFPLTAVAEPRYADMTMPSAGYRLLGLTKFWSAINYFFPYRDLMDEPWDDALEDFIPAFQAASDPVAYAKAIARLGVRTDDSHTSISAAALRDHLGTAFAPMVAREVEGESVLTWVGEGDGLAALDVGDVVVSVDGVPTGERLDALLELTPGSNRAARIRNAHFLLFGGADGSTLEVAARKPDGRIVRSAAKRAQGAIPRWTAYAVGKTATAAEMLDSEIGYLDISRVRQETFEPSIAAIAGAEHMIFDMRGYPNIPVTGILQRLANSTGTGAQLSTPLVRSLDPSSRSFETNRQPLTASAAEPIPGRVAILVNRWAQSAAEHTILFLKAAFGDRATIIGEPSAGANGTITYAYLPGGVTVSFTGMSVSWPDGRQLQRVGIQPDLVVRPTIAGVRAGRDEVLEAAAAHLRRGG